MSLIERPTAMPITPGARGEQRLIAIRRTTHTERRGTLARASLAEDVLQYSEAEARSALEAVLGLREVQPRSEPGVETQPERTFVPLPLTQCVVVESDDPRQLVEARDALEDDYHVMPDIPLVLPAPTQSSTADAHDVLPAYPEVTGIEAAHAAGNRGAGAIVAMLDTGCDADHQEFADRNVDYLWVPLAIGGRPREVRGFDTVNHGTHVAEIIGGTRVGIAPEAELLVVSVIESETVPTSLRRIITGLEWILRRISTPENEAKPVVLNMSLGFRREWMQRPRSTT